MDDKEHLEILKKGAKIWNEWREKHNFISPDLSNADLRDTNLSDINLSEAKFISANLRNANLGNANLYKANLSNANLGNAILNYANLSYANLSYAKHNNANLSYANLYNADLSNADLSRANLSDVNFIGAKLLKTNLCNANLSKAKIIDANASGAKLIKANLNQADLSRSNFNIANLNDSDLTGGYLIKTNLTGANLIGTNLTGASLVGANFMNADLSGASFKGAMLRDTIFVNTSLVNSLYLEACKHYAPSVIDHRTLNKSGKLSLQFLRGCGLPDFIIDNLSMLNGNAIEFYSCFISYSVKDREFAERLHADLQNNGVRCWFAPEDMKGGEKLNHQIDEAIRIHDKLLLVLSEASMKSNWVATEIKKAIRRQEKEGRQMLFPISITSYENNIKGWELFYIDLGRDLAEEIRSYFIPDFTEWKTHESYQKAFKRLIENLKGNKKSTDISSKNNTNALHKD